MTKIILNKITLFLISLIFISSCNNVKKSEKDIEQNKITENIFKLNTKEDTSKFETLYNDGRVTGVRNSKYYNYLIKSNVPFGEQKLGLTTVITEWNKYDANVAYPQGSFIQVPLFLPEQEKKEMAKIDVDTNSTMVGGDEETNRRIKEPSIRYWKVASKMFEEEFKNLKKADGISNRDTNYVTFDFISTSGLYTVQELKSRLENNQSVWSNLFKESKFLNAEMARVQNESANESQKKYEEKQMKKKIK